MKLLEYEAKKILSTSGVAVPKSFIITNDQPNFLPVVIKSQVPVGGRGKAGGVVIVTTPMQFSTEVKRVKILSIKGHTPRTLLGEQALDIQHEYYLALLVDRQSRSIILMGHRDGGIDVEDHMTDDFLRLTLTPQSLESAGDTLADYFELPEKAFILSTLIERLYDCFTKNDAILMEINPLVITKQGEILAGDCKMELDDAAAFRHPEWQFEQEHAEVNFVTLDQTGEVATIANGAGLAMATVDAVADAGMKPANFLDIGGGANEASILAAFKRIMQYPNIKVIIINIFAGITRCDEVAKAVIAAQAQLPDLPPLYIRLAGTNFEEAVALLSQQHIPTLASLSECVEAAKERTS